MPCCCKDNVQACFVYGIVSIIGKLFTLCMAFWLLYMHQGVELHAISATQLLKMDTRTTIHIERILLAIYGMLVSGLLIFGAKKRDPTAILIWMVFAILGLVVLIAVAVLANMVALPFIFITSHPEMFTNTTGQQHVNGTSHPDDGTGSDMTLSTMLIIFDILIGACILFEIWTINVAKRARKEIFNNSPSLRLLQKQFSTTSTTPIFNKV